MEGNDSRICFVSIIEYLSAYKDRRDRMIVGFTTNYAISTYHHLSYEFEALRGVPSISSCQTLLRYLENLQEETWQLVQKKSI
jgi:hypothetical protein